MGSVNRSWEEDIYWTHFQFIHFTLFLRNTDFQQQLALPKTFSDNLKKKLPENVTLKGPSGVVWNIGLTTKEDTVYFTNGWQGFVNDYSLKESDLLFFKYDGESLFEVLIFHGETLCEKAGSYFVRKCGKGHTEQEGDKAKVAKNSVEEVNTASNGGVECGSEKFRKLDTIRTPLAVPFENTNEKTSNAGVESASPEQVMADAVTIVVPSQTTGKKTKKPVNEVTPGQPKKRGRPAKSATASGEKAIVDWVACSKENSGSKEKDVDDREDREIEGGS